MLKGASDALAANGNRPLLEIYHPSPKSSSAHQKDFRKRLPAIVAEAEKYGWQVNPYLQ